MKAKAHFYKLNYDFSPEFAEAHHGGKESQNNRYYDWEDELNITTEIESIEVVENSVYMLQGEIKGEAFKEEVPNMILFNFIDKEGNITQMACSHAIVDKHEIIEEENQITLKVYLDAIEPLTNPIPGIYITPRRFPKSLM